MLEQGTRFTGRILFLTEDLTLIERQIKGEDIEWAPSLKLLENISTDEITPGRVCFYYDETLGEYVYTGLRGGIIRKSDIKNAGFSVAVSGSGKGCGSSREMAPYAELYSGISLVIAPVFEKIYLQNCENIGLLTATDFGIIRRIQMGEEIEKEYFLEGRSSITRTIIDIGGLFNFNKARMKGDLEFGLPVSIRVRRPKTATEKIILSRITLKNVREFFTTGTTVFVRPDIRFSHDYTTAITP
ncbi:MAG: 3-isopropylmalate dehydratase, partial [Deltaproteobacteria bacterium]|nr:3-isopropylmalate dehydratase [Deltaproteobacteria bacterium]